VLVAIAARRRSHRGGVGTGISDRAAKRWVSAARSVVQEGRRGPQGLPAEEPGNDSLSREDAAIPRVSSLTLRTQWEGNLLLRKQNRLRCRPRRDSRRLSSRNPAWGAIQPFSSPTGRASDRDERYLFQVRIVVLFLPPGFSATGLSWGFSLLHGAQNLSQALPQDDFLSRLNGHGN
jgi:hypothetical protein